MHAWHRPIMTVLRIMSKIIALTQVLKIESTKTSNYADILALNDNISKVYIQANNIIT